MQVIASAAKLAFSCLYYGRVKHTRLKGGAIHSLDYPLFFSFIDIEEMSTVASTYWPIFHYNDKSHNPLVFCSLDSKDHLKGIHPEQSLHQRIKLFLLEKCNLSEASIGRIKLLTHLTYFGYCFNPLSVYYIYHKEHPEQLLCLIAEVSNTPWIEQHPYALHESVPGVSIHRTDDALTAVWRKDFHVSPFMEMDYNYSFKFFIPGDTIVVQSQLLKADDTHAVWFTASFQLQRLAFSPLHLLYVLVFYPLHTRLIQLWIHWEAVLLFLKGVPTFEHPNKTDVDFGWGITGKRLGAFLYYLTLPAVTVYQAALRLTTTRGAARDKKLT